MERTEVLDLMSGLKLYGMRSAYDETLTTALKRKHEPQRFVGDLLKAEISEKQARSIKYQLTVAKLPLAKDVDDFAFKETPINNASRSQTIGSFTHCQVSLAGQPSPVLGEPAHCLGQATFFLRPVPEGLRILGAVLCRSRIGGRAIYRAIFDTMGGLYAYKPVIDSHPAPHISWRRPCGWRDPFRKPVRLNRARR
jgi:hypothetical protein